MLPFENLSEDKAKTYFAEGIQEEILTRLAKIADLKGNFAHFDAAVSKQTPQSRSDREAAGVANFLEGSVQKAGDQVRVNVHLVNVQSDSHLWAETFDRKLIDILRTRPRSLKELQSRCKQN